MDAFAGERIGARRSQDTFGDSGSPTAFQEQKYRELLPPVSRASKAIYVSCRPNRFGRSFGRKFGVLYDDYVNGVFVSACVINKMEDDIVLHTQEVTGSSPVAPTIRINDIQTD